VAGHGQPAGTNQQEDQDMRTPTNQVTLTTWTLRVDVTDLNLTTAAHVSAARDMVADATGQRVSLGLTANIRGTLLDLIAERDGYATIGPITEDDIRTKQGRTNTRVGN
jgi:hypothetical protein